jgi:hypothetical protein
MIHEERLISIIIAPAKVFSYPTRTWYDDRLHLAVGSQPVVGMGGTRA